MPSIVNAAYTVLKGNNITNAQKAICLQLGKSGYGRATDTVIKNNKIYGCGSRPATNFDHGIYAADSDRAQITNNLIYGNADRGVQLHPDAQYSYIANNIIDGNRDGVRFSGDTSDYTQNPPRFSRASSSNLVENNLITFNSRENVGSFYPEKVGTGNVVSHNCVYAEEPVPRDNDKDNFDGPPYVGYTVTADNITNSTDPIYPSSVYVDEPGRNYSLQPGSPCQSLGAGLG